MPKAKKKSGPYTRPEPGISTRSHRKRPTAEPTPPVTDSIRPSTSNEAAGANNDHLATNYCANNVNGPSTSYEKGNVYHVHGLHARTVLDPKTEVINWGTNPIDSGVKDTFSKEEVTSLISKVKYDILIDLRTSGNINDSKPKVTSLTAAQDTVLSQPASLGLKSTDSKLRELHYELSLRLDENITTQQLTGLKQSFHGEIGNRILEEIKSFLDLWNELESRTIIEIQWYGRLAKALEVNNLSCHLGLIEEYETMMKYQGKEIDETRDLHNRLSLLLSQNLTVEQFKNLKQQFHHKPFRDGDLEKITNFRELWIQLEMCGAIRVGDYNKLKSALEYINADGLLRDIQECENKMALYKGTESEEIRDLHNRLSLLLSQSLTVEHFKNLKHQFRKKPFGDGDLEKITNFHELWNQLEMCGAIRVGDYNKLKPALESICADGLLRDIQECENKMALYKGKN